MLVNCLPSDLEMFRSYLAYVMRMLFDVLHDEAPNLLAALLDAFSHWQPCTP
jgi:hypothetical protein